MVASELKGNIIIRTIQKSRKPGYLEKNLSEQGRTINKLNPHTCMASRPRFGRGPHLWEASALTTAPPLLSDEYRGRQIIFMCFAAPLCQQFLPIRRGRFKMRRFRRKDINGFNVVDPAVACVAGTCQRDSQIILQLRLCNRQNWSQIRNWCSFKQSPGAFNWKNAVLQ